MANSEASATIVLKNEGHTLGNAMRYMLIKHPETKFAGARHK
jgi:DNA-directed RNA polymerase subunit L